MLSSCVYSESHPPPVFRPCDMFVSFDLSHACKVRGQDGAIEIRGDKSQRILLMLCVADDNRLPREVLCQRLWGSRDAQSARNSLRQELSKLRKSFGPDAGVICADRGAVWLDPAHARIAELSAEATALDWAALPHEPRFEAWLTDLRRYLRFGTGPQPAAKRSSATRRRNLGLIAAIQTEVIGTHREEEFAYLAQMELIEALTELTGVLIVDPQAVPAEMPDLVLRLSVVRAGEDLKAMLTPRRNDTGAFMAPVSSVFLKEALSSTLISLSASCFANDAREHLVRIIREHGNSFSRPESRALRLAYQGVELMFSRTPGAADRAQLLMDQALEHIHGSSLLAWRAYLTALHLEESSFRDHDDMRRRAVDDIEEALALEPQNGLTAALAASVFGFILNDQERAARHAATALERRPNHVMTQDAVALTCLYRGKLEPARMAAFRTEHLGRHLTSQYCFATSLLMVEALSGNFQEARLHGERALTLVPRRDSRPYPPTLRYLAICCTQLGAYDRAQSLFQQLERLEASDRKLAMERSLSLMPSAAARALLKDSLNKIGH